MNNGPVPVLATTTAPTVEDARRIAHRLVEEKLAACVQMVDPITSVYRWQGAVEEQSERIARTEYNLSHPDEVIYLVDESAP